MVYNRGFIYGTECQNDMGLYLYCRSCQRAQLFTIIEALYYASLDFPIDDCIFIIDGDFIKNVVFAFKKEFPNILTIKYEDYRPSNRKVIYIVYHNKLTKDKCFQQMRRTRKLNADIAFLPFSVFSPFEGDNFMYFSGSLVIPLYTTPDKFRAMLLVKKTEGKYFTKNYDFDKFTDGVLCKFYSAGNVYTVGKSWDTKNHILGYYDDYNTASEYWIIYGYLKKTRTIGGDILSELYSPEDDIPDSMSEEEKEMKFQMLRDLEDNIAKPIKKYNEDPLHIETIKILNRLNISLNKISDNNKVMCHIYNYIQRLRKKGTKKEISIFFKMKDELFKNFDDYVKKIKESDILSPEEIEEQIKSYSNTPWFFFNIVNGQIVVYYDHYNDLKMEMYRLMLLTANK